MNGITCCRGCTERYTACHDTCEKYRENKREWDEKRAKISEQKHDPYFLYKVRRIIKEEGRER